MSPEEKEEERKGHVNGEPGGGRDDGAKYAGTCTWSRASWNVSKSLIHSTAKPWSTMSVLFMATTKGSLVL